MWERRAFISLPLDPCHERVYRRLGSGNFGRLPSMLRQDRLLMELGTYPDVQVKDGQGQELAKGFKRKEDGLEKFVLI